MSSDLRGQDQEALLRRAGTALEALRPLCAGDVLEVSYLELTMEIARGLV